MKYLCYLSAFLLLAACKPSFVGKKYQCTEDSRYIKFIDDKLLEWKWNEKFHPEEFDYNLEEKQIRTTRKAVMNQIRYVNVINEDSLEYKGWIYKREK